MISKKKFWMISWEKEKTMNILHAFILCVFILHVFILHVFILRFITCIYSAYIILHVLIFHIDILHKFFLKLIYSSPFPFPPVY